MPTRQQLLLIAKARQRQSGGGAPAASPWGNLDPAQVPPRNPPMSFREGLAGTVGEMLRGVPIAGPALLGTGERLAAAKHSLTDDKPYAEALEDVQTRQENFRRDKPVTAGSAQAGGASLAMTGAGMAFPRMMGVTGGNLLTRTLAGGGSSGAVFGADAAVRGDDPEAGAIAGAASGMLGPLFSQFITPQGPTTQALRTQARNAINRFRQAGAVVSAPRVSQLMDDMLMAGRAVGMRPRSTSRTWELTDDIQQLRGNAGTNQGVDLERLYTLRQDLGRIERTTDPIGSNEGEHDRTAAGALASVFDDFMDQISPADVVAGNPQQAQQSLEEFRRTWGTMRKAELMETLFDRVSIDASKYSQSGYENALRNEFRNVVKNERLMRGFSPEETKALRKLATGTIPQRAARNVGRFALRGPVSGLSAIGTTAVAGPVAGLGLAGAGEIGRGGATALAAKNARLAEALIRGGGQMPEMSPQRQGIAALIQALLSGGGGTAARLSGGGGY